MASTEDPSTLTRTNSSSVVTHDADPHGKAILHNRLKSSLGKYIQRHVLLSSQGTTDHDDAYQSTDVNGETDAQSEESERQNVEEETQDELNKTVYLPPGHDASRWLDLSPASSRPSSGGVECDEPGALFAAIRNFTVRLGAPSHGRTTDQYSPPESSVQQRRSQRRGRVTQARPPLLPPRARRYSVTPPDLQLRRSHGRGSGPLGPQHWAARAQAWRDEQDASPVSKQILVGTWLQALDGEPSPRTFRNEEEVEEIL